MVALTPVVRSRMQQMVDALKHTGRIRSPGVEQAFLAIPRHLFINRLHESYVTPGRNEWIPLDPLCPQEASLDLIYSADTAILQKLTPPTSSSAPAVMAPMLEALEARAGLTVLEIGAGSGYNAALLASIVGKQGCVYTLEHQPDVAEEAERNLHRAGVQGVQVVCADGGEGYAPGAPYQRMLATASLYDIPPAWPEQLTEGGLVVAPVWMAPGFMPIVKLAKQQATLVGCGVAAASFMALQGAYGYQELRGMVNAETEERLAAVLAQPIAEGRELPVHLDGDPEHQFHRFQELIAFVHLREAQRAIRLWAPSSQRWAECALWDREAASVAVLWGRDWKVSVYGNDAMDQRFMELLRLWQTLGMPGITAYQMRVVPGREALAPRKPDTVVQVRTWNTWEISIVR